MSEFELIPPQRSLQVSFSPEPAYNGLCSLMLLNEQLSGFGEWAERTLAALSPERRRVNALVCDSAAAYLGGESWSSFPAWVDDLERRDPHEMRELALARLLDHVRTSLGAEAGELPSPARLLADREAYLSLTQRLLACKDLPLDRERYEQEHDLLQEPAARQALVVRHLRQMWDEHLAREWDRSLPTIQASAAAFAPVNYHGLSSAEIVQRVSGRDRAPREWDRWLPEMEMLIFIPSVHIGPYLLVMDHSGTTARVVFGARQPRGVAADSPALGRSELLTRLGALADDTRLRMLELLAREGELGAQEIMARLDLSQSATSRHVRQLTATGYLAERRREGAKYYRLNPERLDDTMDSLRRLLG
jgi:DNA-binding transcriptional ArsR family regulator